MARVARDNVMRARFDGAVKKPIIPPVRADSRVLGECPRGARSDGKVPERLASPAVVQTEPRRIHTLRLSMKMSRDPRGDDKAVGGEGRIAE